MEMKREPLPNVDGASAGKTRGKFLIRCAQFLAGLGLLRIRPERAMAQASQGPAGGSDSSGKPPYNIVFIIVDQRVEKLLAGSDYSLPAMKAFASHGVTFSQHFISVSYTHLDVYKRQAHE